MKFKTLPEIEIDLDKNRTPDSMGNGFRNPISDGINRLRNIALGNYYNFYMQLKKESPLLDLETFATFLKVSEQPFFFTYVQEIEDKLHLYDVSEILTPPTTVLQSVTFTELLPDISLRKEGVLVQDSK